MSDSLTNSFDAKEFRRVLGHYPTGVCAVTAMVDNVPVGMIVGSFTSASLDPPLVAFLPDKRSTTWPRIAATKRFGISILSERQDDVCKAIASRSANRFETVGYRASASGTPMIAGSVAWIDCDLHACLDAGDHHVVLGRVRSLEVGQAGRPLLFFQGGYGQFSPLAAES
jgi:flavin reductase (DIM6/NTAB) family NADH-FMN oxidoreductase RutF